MTIWVCEYHHLASRPMIKKYDGIEVRESGVLVNDHTKRRFIAKAQFRRFFTDEKEMMEWARKRVMAELKRAKETVASLERALSREDLDIIIDRVSPNPYPPVNKNLKL